MEKKKKTPTADYKAMLILKGLTNNELRRNVAEMGHATFEMTGTW